MNISDNIAEGMLSNMSKNNLYFW